MFKWFWTIFSLGAPDVLLILNSARALHFLKHFFDVYSTTTAWNFLMEGTFIEDLSTPSNFLDTVLKNSTTFFF